MTNTDDPAGNGAAQANARAAARRLRDERRRRRRAMARTVAATFRALPDVARWRCLVWAAIGTVLQWAILAVLYAQPEASPSWPSWIIPTVVTAVAVPYMVWLKRQGTKGWGWYLHRRGRLMPTMDDIANGR